MSRLLTGEEIYHKVLCNIPQLKPNDDLVPLCGLVAKAQQELSDRETRREIGEWLESRMHHATFCGLHGVKCDACKIVEALKKGEVPK